MKSPVFDVEIVEPIELEMRHFKEFLEAYPVTVFQELNKKLNERKLAISIISSDFSDNA